MNSEYNRQQEEKALKKAIEIVKRRDETCVDAAEVIRRALKIKDHRQSCSCAMCCNPRHSSFSKGKEKLTIQERKENERNRTPDN